jgi:hypothetical protein
LHTITPSLTPSSPRIPEPLVDDELQRDMDQNPNPVPQPEAQPQPMDQLEVEPEQQPDVQILAVIDASNEDREVRNWRLENVHWIGSLVHQVVI